MVTHFSIFAWRIPWTGEPGGLQPIGPKRVEHNWVILSVTWSQRMLTWNKVILIRVEISRRIEWILGVKIWRTWIWISSVQLLSRVWLFVTPWTVDYQAPLSMEFSRQKYWSGSPVPSPGDLPDPRIKSRSPAMQVDSLPTEPPGIYTILLIKCVYIVKNNL